MGKLFYGTQSGMTQDVAEQIQAAMPDLISEVIDISRSSPEEIQNESLLILGSSNWGDGELTDDWDFFWPKMDQIDFTGKQVALFSVGDSYSYCDHFCSAMRIFYDKVLERGATIVGRGGHESEYDFSHSDAVIGGYFVGLAVDELNESDKTAPRIDEWSQRVRSELLVQTA
jgi:flavodoxin I